MTPSVTFGRRVRPPATAEPAQFDLAVSPPRPDARDASPSAAPDRPASRTHRFAGATDHGSLDLLEREILESVESGAVEIIILVTSPGGLLLPMLEVYRRLISLPVKIRTHAIGSVASAGTVLMMAGAERSADPGATFLFHPVSVGPYQSASAFQTRSIERHRQLFELTAHEIYKARTRLPPETIARFGEATLVFDAPTAVRFGIVDRIETFGSV
ncbi:MAG: ATP-dependent Clp protease proteolytic subunit [Roseiarcus sp.]|jgi:ATP-dependent Clp protease, protease subunit